MNNYLQNQPPVYNRFIDNQVLTENQLNALVDHINYEDKVTRSMLIGVGIVCGLQIKLSTDGDKVHLSEGIAITTDGDLISIKEKEFIGFKLFSDNNARYSRFLEEDKTIPLWELTTTTDASDVASLKEFKKYTDFETGAAIALLYLEHYHKEPKDCSPVDCDSQGEEVVNQPRLLLIDPKKVDVIVKDDSIFSGLLYKGSESIRALFDPVHIPRVIHTRKDYYTNDFVDAYKVDFSELSKRLDVLSQIPLLQKVYDDAKVNHQQRLKNIQRRNEHFQYRYDFYKDLAEAYHELSEVLQEDISICFPDPASFPKHILLGALKSKGDTFRHGFYPSPAQNGSVTMERAQKCFRRILFMIRDFQTRPLKEVKITPSETYNSKLGKRAVPVYYDLDSADDPSLFIENWKERQHFLTLNYYHYGYPSQFNPLDIYLKGHDFYRIEGHMGGSVQDVHRELEQIKKEKGLSFKITSVAIGGNAEEDSLDFGDYRMYFEDLQAILQAWNEEQKCIVAQVTKFLAGFDLEEPGKHKTWEPTYDVESNKERRYKAIPLEENVIISAFSKKTTSEDSKTPKEIKKRKYLGNVISDKINTITTGNDLIVKTKRSMGNLREWNPDQLEVFVDIPLDLIGILKETEDDKLSNIEDFTPENLEKFIESLTAQCDKARQSIERIQELISKEDNPLASKAWSQSYLQTLQKIQSSCCLAEKMKSLYHNILERKNLLLKQFQFNAFIEKHPGAEHFCGVPKGGTFVLVYDVGNNRSFQKGVVLGDLSMPYLCCTDVPAVTFVLPEKTEVNLQIPVDSVCVAKEEDSEVIPLKVTPSSGTVKAYFEKTELSGAIVQNEEGIFFHPAKVPENNFNNPIKFTVNDQPVEATIILYEKPKPEFRIGGDIEFRKKNTVATVPFENKTGNLEKYSFLWDFGDGETATTRDRNFTHSFNVVPGEELTVEVKLTVRDETCSATKSDFLKINIPALDVDEPVEDCKKYAITHMMASIVDLQEVFKKNQEELQDFQQPLKNIQNSYQKWVKYEDKLLKGNFDKEVSGFIVKYQNAALNAMEDKSDVQKLFSMILYYEMALLYFYIQACREEEIDPIPAINRRLSSNWATATKLFTSKYRKTFVQALENSSLFEKFNKMDKRFGNRYGSDLKPIMKNILIIMKEYSGN